ncbi:MAG: sulfite exporter TauE/SafE family protein [Granulosicoccaceae bacterium]
MDNGALYMAALLAGLLGATHCIGMCGSISAALSLSFPKETLRSTPKRLLHLLAINLGRLSGYACIGAATGFLGSSTTTPLDPEPALWLSTVITACVLVALGIYYMGFTGILSPLEQLGHKLWRRVQPITLKLQPGRQLPISYGSGFLWAFLPCGMVYGAAALAFASGNAVTGAQIMALFGLATLPTLISAGFFAAELDKLLQQPWVRRLAGTSLLILAAFFLWQATQ